MREFVVMIGGLPHTVQLSEEEAQRIGATPVESKQATPKNKQRKPRNKSNG